MLAHRLRRRSNINPTLVQCFVFAGSLPLMHTVTPYFTDKGKQCSAEVHHMDLGADGRQQLLADK